VKVVADASVLIFLGKIRQLDLLKRLFQGPFYLSGLVRDEVLTEGIPPEESDYLEKILASWQVMAPLLPKKPGKQLSFSDWSVVELAKQIDADIVLADEKALRHVLAAQGIPVIGTLGLLLRAAQAQRLPASEVRTHVDMLIRSHRFRISAETYQVFLAHLAKIS
jgi:predicted nucleic acid-binding protein